MGISCVFPESTMLGELQKKRKHRHEILKEVKKKRTRNKREKKPQTLCLCTPMVIIKTVDAENESVYFLEKLNVASCPPIYV